MMEKRAIERDFAVPRIVEAQTEGIRLAAERLRHGQVVAFPTETVYGLGADTFDRAALRRIYELKGRPVDNPLIAHVTDSGQARELLGRDWSEQCTRLADRFWPGPLTLIVSRRDAVPNEATGGRLTIAVRSPSHPVARALLDMFGGPISAPSANVSGHVSPTRAAHVARDFAGDDDLLILDGGACEVGIESTVIDMTSAIPTILRPGSVTVESLRDVIGDVVVKSVLGQAASPGTQARHYSPHTVTKLVERGCVASFVREHTGHAMVVIGLSALPEDCDVVQMFIMPSDPEAYAQRLYETLRAADELQAELILIERPPDDTHGWEAVLNRLERAAAD